MVDNFIIDAFKIAVSDELDFSYSCSFILVDDILGIYVVNNGNPNVISSVCFDILKEAGFEIVNVSYKDNKVVAFAKIKVTDINVKEL